MRDLGVDPFTWVGLALFLLTVLALRSIWTSGGHARKVKFIWSVLAFFPLLGPLGWFVLGRSRRRRR
jgi:hypothetical protein